uniref:non-specific serine/threonine protein kinase n=1 Tax=Phallusia mammillata TaxID=59560 RepID=A0A6F9DRS4_9ASCI|nr:rho-associated protein kinase 2 [Phallusia mammillata]
MVKHYFMHRTVETFGTWGYQQITNKCKNVFKTIENVVTKVTTKHNVSLAESLTQSVSKSEFPIKSVKSWWKPSLESYNKTLKGNAKRAQQVLRSNDVGLHSVFSKDFLWRRARKGHLIAFAGLFLYQEDIQRQKMEAKAEYHIYDRICSNMKNFFPAEDNSAQILPDDRGNSLSDYKLTLPVSVDVSGTVFDATLAPEADEKSLWDFCESSLEEEKVFPSQEFSIKAMHPVPRVVSQPLILKYHEVELSCCGYGQYTFHNGNGPKKKALPPHHNIIRFEKVFFGNLNEELNPSECDPTLFAVTKRYETNLALYMRQNNVDNITASLILLQLLQAVVHLENHCFVHRNITPENILLEFDSGGIPHVVLSGFGSCFGGRKSELVVPFEDEPLDTRVGKLSNLPPEVSRAKPGKGCKVDYHGNDAWMVGVIAFEMLTGRSLFADHGLDSRTYKESDIPDLNNTKASNTLKAVVRSLVSVDPQMRMSAKEAAEILHLEIFATVSKAPLGDALLLSNLRSWAVSHCAEVFLHKSESSVLYKLCEGFFHQVDAHHLLRSVELWMLINS